jgi:S-adenosyl methyltransferase
MTGPEGRRAADAATKPAPQQGTTESNQPIAPSIAGIYNVLLGGRGRCAADQDAAGALLQIVPGTVTAAYQNRRFLRTAVHHLATHAGIRQFIDIGCGFLMADAVHEVASALEPRTRVAYVDRDPAVVTELSTAFRDVEAVEAMLGDVRRPESILAESGLRSLIDLAEPVAIILSAVLHFVSDDDDPNGIVSAFTDAMAPDSQLVLSHSTGDQLPAAAVADSRRIFETTGTPFVPRSHDRICALFNGLDVTAPGVVDGAAWRPGSVATDPRRTIFYAGLGRKR